MLFWGQKYLSDPNIIFYLSIVWFSIIALGIYIYYDETHLKSPLFTIGPGKTDETTADFFGFKIDNWSKVIYLMFFGFVSQVFLTFYQESVYPWIINNVLDSSVRKVPLSKWKMMLISNTVYFTRWLNKLILLFINLTKQLQFIVPTMLGEVITSYVVTRHNINRKY